MVVRFRPIELEYTVCSYFSADPVNGCPMINPLVSLSTFGARAVAFLALLYASAVVEGQVIDIPTATLDEDVAPVQPTQFPDSSFPSVPQPPLADPQSVPAAGQPVAPQQSFTQAQSPQDFAPQQPVPQQPVPQQPVPQQPAPQPTVPLQTAPQPTPGPIEQLQQPIQQQPFTPPSANLASSLSQGLGAAPGSFAASPTMIGDFFGGGFSGLSGSQTVTYSGYSPGTILSGVPGGGEFDTRF